MIQIKCSKCNAIHKIKKESVIKLKGKEIAFKCKKCNKPIKLVIN